MARLRRPALAIVLACAVLVVGSGVAALPTAENDPCLWPTIDAPLPRGEEFPRDVRYSVDLVPYGARCEVEVTEGTTIVTSYAPSVGAFVAWLAVCAALLVLALRRPGSAAARGAVLATALLGLLGGLHHQGEYTAAGFGMLLLGAPMTYALDRLLGARPRGTDQLRSAVLALVLPLIVLIFWTVPAFVPLDVLAIFSGLGAGSLTSWLVARSFRARPSLRPA